MLYIARSTITRHVIRLSVRLLRTLRYRVKTATRVNGIIKLRIRNLL